MGSNEKSPQRFFRFVPRTAQSSDSLSLAACAKFAVWRDGQFIVRQLDAEIEFDPDGKRVASESLEIRPREFFPVEYFSQRRLMAATP